MVTELAGVLSRLEDVSKPDDKGYYQAVCPFHKEKRTALDLHAVAGYNCHGGCGSGSLVELEALLDLRSLSHRLPDWSGITPRHIAELTDVVRFPLTESGNASVFAHLFGDGVRFLHRQGVGGAAAGDWYIWDGVRWARDAVGEVVEMAKVVGRARRLAADRISDPEVAKKAWTAAKTANGRYGINAMLDLARSLPGIRLAQGSFDLDPWPLCVINGTVDLKTGQLRDSKPEDLLSMQAGVAFDANAKCPTWLKFLDEVFLRDQELIGFVQRLVGHALNGQPAVYFAIFWGPGRNGKSTFIGVIQELLGDYAAQAQITTFMPQRAEKVRNDLARLLGKRLVGATEQAQGWPLDEGVVKQVTGGDRVVARYLYHEHEEKVPFFKVWLAVNHKPEIVDTSVAMWERLVIVPFLAIFLRGDADLGMRDKLLAERAGILNWAIIGCLTWQKDGLNPPKSVLSATAEYREESDPVSRWIEESCDLGKGKSVSAAILHEYYDRWARAYGEERMSQKKFGTRLSALGFQRRKDSKGSIIYDGIDLAIKP